MLRACLFAVPNVASLTSGPAVRVSNMARVFSGIPGARVIRGSFRQKLMLTFDLDRYDVLYVESSTNRLALVDYLCLFFLRLKSRKMVVYIRDVYFEAFPESFDSVKGRMRHFLNRLTNIFYVTASDALGFPTMRMGDFFFEHHCAGKRKKAMAIPPGTVRVENFSDLGALAARRTGALKFIYVGGIGYRYSGIEKMLRFAERSGLDAEYFVVTRDTEISQMVAGLPKQVKNRVRVLALDMEQTIRLIDDEGITFAVHPRPRNPYDDMTYPIKFFDYISWLLPILTDRHEPLVDVLGEGYSLFCDLDDAATVAELVNSSIDGAAYLSLLGQMVRIRDENLYESRVESILGRKLS